MVWEQSRSTPTCQVSSSPSLESVDECKLYPKGTQSHLPTTENVLLAYQILIDARDHTLNTSRVLVPLAPKFLHTWRL